MEPVKVAEVIRVEKGEDLVIKGFSSVSKKFLLTIWNDDDVLSKNVNAT